ncbi:hypothetical protein FHG87_018561 [Trinorchestia longiramus]|nr:hypothetical protein FHG87_018561 [Trinorchestia longiramus]
MEWIPSSAASIPARPTSPASPNAAVVVSATLCVLSAVDCIVSALCITIATRQLCRICVVKAGPGGRWRLSEGHSRKERLYRWLGQQKTIFPIGTATSGTLRPGAPVPSVSHFVPLSESSPSPSIDDPKHPKSTGYFSHPSIAPDKLESQDLPAVYCTPKLGLPTLMPNERYASANPPLKSGCHTTFAKFANANNFSSKKRKFYERDLNSSLDTAHHQKVFRPAMKAYHPVASREETSAWLTHTMNKRHGLLSYSQSCLLTAAVRHPSSSGLRTPRSSGTASAIVHRKNVLGTHAFTLPNQRNPACAPSTAPSLHSFYSDPTRHFSLPYYYKGYAAPQRYYSASEGHYALPPVRRFKRDPTPRQGPVSSVPQALYGAPSNFSWHYSAPLYSTTYGYAPEPRCSQTYGCPTQKSDRKRHRKERLRRRHTATAHSSSSEKRFDASERRRDKRRKCEGLTDDQIDRTYTGLDRAIAEVFIDSTMQTSR